MEFRRSVWAAAARQSDIDARVDTAEIPRDLLAGVSSTDREDLVRTLVAGLRELPPSWTPSYAFSTIVGDLDHLTRYDVPLVLDTELSGTPAGDALARMRADIEENRARYERQREEAAERRRVKRDKRAVAHADRVAETRRRNAARLELLAALARLSPAERLSRVANDPAIRLDCLSAELIPSQARDLIDLKNDDAVMLLIRIGRRRGPWGRLRRTLEHQIKPA